MLRSRARLASGTRPFCCANMVQLVSYRLPYTCSTDTFFTKHSSRTRGAVPNMLDLRRRSSFPILFRCGMIQLATAQNCSVKCVVIRVRDDVDGVGLRTHFHHDWNTSHAVTVLREKGVDVTSHNKHVRNHFLLFRIVVSRGLRSWIKLATCLCLLSWRKSVVVQETSQEHRSGARQGPVSAADRHSRFLT